MKTYRDALDWIDIKSKEYGGKNKFFSSEEYRQKYPEIERLHIESLLNISEKGKEAMKEVGAKEGQKVHYDFLGSFGYVSKQEGTIIFSKKGIPKVKLTSGNIVKWHKGFKPL